MAKHRSGWLGVALFAALSCLVSSPAPAAYRITYDEGGEVGRYVAFYTGIRLSGGRIIIDGMCFSACTLVAALMPKDRVCVTPFARLAFHSVRAGHSGAYHREWTREFWAMFPPNVRAIVQAQGWDGESEHPDFIYIEGDELRSIFDPCHPLVN